MAQHDISEARQSYEKFIGMAKWSSVAVAIIVAFVVLIIS